MGIFDLLALAVWLREKYFDSGDDLSVSKKLVKHLDLPSSTASFVLALQVPQAPGSVVYILVSQQLSERSATDAELLIAAVRPKVVVAQIEGDSLEDVLQEESVLATADGELQYPTSILAVIKERFLNTVSFENGASASVARAIFGTGFFGRVIAAKQAAAAANSSFCYLEFPYREQTEDSASEENNGAGSSEASGNGGSSASLSRVGDNLVAELSGKLQLATLSVLKDCARTTESAQSGAISPGASEESISVSSTVSNKDNPEVCGPATSAGTLETATSCDREEGRTSLGHSSGVEGGGRMPAERGRETLQNSVQLGTRTKTLAELPQQWVSPSSLPHLKALSPAISSCIGRLKTASLSDREETAEIVAHECPAFALPLDSWLSALHEFYKEAPGMRQALVVTRKMLVDVERGSEVSSSDLAIARSFRVAVEAVRTGFNTSVRIPMKVLEKSGPGSNGINFMELPYYDQCNVLLAQALQNQARKFGTVVAIMDASSVLQIRKYWNTTVPPEVAAAGEDCLIPLDLDVDQESEEHGKVSDRKDTKTVVVVGAGAAAAVGLASISHWAPVSSVAKVLTFKMPTIVKLGLLHAKRSVAFLATKVAPTSQAMVPSVAAPSNALFGTSGKVSSLAKAVLAAEQTKATASSLVGAAQRASLSAIRMGFYNVMRKRQGMQAGSRPWLILGSSVLAGGGLLLWGDGVERVIADLPSTPGLARLARGLENLRSASSQLQDDPLSIWEDVYGRLYNFNKF